MTIGLATHRLSSYDSYIEVLAEALQTNRCMETLNLTPVVMTVDRAITIAEALDPNTIIAVKFHDNNEEAKRAFAKRMKKKRRASESSMPPTTPPPSLKQTAEVVALTRKLRKQESRIEKFEQEYAILEEENGELCDAKEELESDNHGLRQANATLKKKQQSIQKELSATTASLQDAQCQIAELEKQMEALREKLQEAVDNATHLESRNEQLLKDAALLAENTKLKGDWESKLEGVLNLNIPSSRFANKVPVFDIRGKPIGGAFGMLHRAELAGQPVALKQLFVVERPRLSDILASIDGAEDVPDHVKQMRREALVLLSLRHPNIVHFLGLTHDEVNHMLAFVLSWAENGSLFDLLHVKKHTLDKPARARIALEIVSAMAFLHAHNVVHRDLKSPNVLLDASLSAKVTDFGLSAFKSADKSVVSKVDGTPLWASPEQLLKMQELRADTDVFSFAVLLWELFLNIKPWHHGQYAAVGGASMIDIAMSYKAEQYLPLDGKHNGQSLDNAQKQLLRQCFDVSGNRPSFSQLQGTLRGQYTAAKEKKQVDVQEQRELLQGPDNAAWKWQQDVLKPLQPRTTTHPTRASVRIAVVEAKHKQAASVAQQMIGEAGGRSAEEAVASSLKPFGTGVYGVAVVQCSQKNAAFNGALHRNQTRYRGHMSSNNHPFHPKYQVDQATGAPINTEEAAVLARVSLHPAGAASYKVLDQAMMQPDVRLRLQRVFHGVPSFAVAMSILGGDFAQLQKTDNGWYGAGFYFTPDLDYALRYTKKCKDVPAELKSMKLPAGKQFRVVLVCDVQYGNPYPVLDAVTFDGKPLVGAHDAHVAVVDFSTGKIGGAKPIKSSKWASKRTAAEIVINDPSCVLVRGILVFEA